VGVGEGKGMPGVAVHVRQKKEKRKGSVGWRRGKSWRKYEVKKSTPTPLEQSTATVTARRPPLQKERRMRRAVQNSHHMVMELRWHTLDDVTTPQ
jgi:hypothetical protein